VALVITTRKRPIVVATLAACALLVLVLALTNRMAMAYVVIAIFTVFAAVAPQRWGFAALFFFTGFSGLLKDFANYHIVAHLANDFVIAGLVAGHVVRARLGLVPLIPRGLPLRVAAAFLFFGSVLLTVVGIINEPHGLPGTTLIQALGGWKAYVEPAILVPVAVVALAQAGSLRPTVWALVIVGVANAGAALWESSLGPGVVAGWGPGFEHTVKGAVVFFDAGGIHGTWRPFGLAQDAGAASLFEMAAGVLLLQVALGRVKGSALLRLCSLALIPFIAFAVFRTGVRTSVVALVIGLGLALVFARPRRLLTSLLAVGALGVLVVGLGYLAYFVSTLTPALHVRMAGLLEFQTYITSRGELFKWIATAAHYPFGIGMGTTVPSSDALAALAHRPVRASANENILLSMMLELGWFGAAVVIALLVELLSGMVRYLRRPVDVEVGQALLLCALMLIVGLAGPVMVSVPSNLILWVLGAVALQRLQPVARRETDTAPAPAPVSRLLVISHTYTVAHNRTKLRIQRDLMRERGGDFMALVPEVVHEPLGVIRAEITEAERDYVKSWPAWPLSRNSIRLLAPGWTKILDEFKPTHVHVEEEPFSLISLQIARAARKRGAHFSFFSWENLERTLPLPLPMVESVVCLLADHAVAGNRGAAERLAKRMPDIRISVVPQLGIDVPDASHVHGNGAPARVIYVGRLVEEKGVLDLAEAALACRDIEVTFLGAGPLAAPLAAYSERGAAVRVLSKVPHDRVREHMLEHDVLVLPSRPHPRWIEQFGHVLIEAMAVGVVPVGSDSGAIPEVIGNTKLIFPHGDVGELSRLLRGLAGNPKRRATLGRHFRNLARDKFSHERVARATLDQIGVLHPTVSRRVLLVADSPSERWTSMDLYAKEVSVNLKDSYRDGSLAMLQPPGPPSRHGVVRSLRVLLDRYLVLPFAVRRSESEVVHVLDQTYAHLIRQARPAKVAITCHDLTPLELPRFSIGWLLYRQAVQGIRSADRVIAISEATRRRLIDHLGIAPDKVTVAPYGLDPAFFDAQWSGPGTGLRILHVGSNADYKRVWLVTETAARLAAKHPGVELWKVGDSLGRRANARLAQLGVEVRDFGRVPNLQLPQIYADASLLLFPSAYEGFGRPVAEAMAAGLPVVASAIDTLVEVTGGNAIHISETSPEAFADVIEGFLQDPSQMQDLSERGRAWASRYRWEPHCQALREVYRDLSATTEPVLSGA
jgi:glycosyltransferase involved in cell wall biosynthesis